MDKEIRYENGLRAVVESTSTHSVAIGIWINAGSRKEKKENNGISHFIEHMLFKGTDKLNAFEIARGFEDRGAMINAFTGKDSTCYYFRSLSSEAEECFKLLSHIFLNSTFPEEELDRERKVILEEINMQEDSPEDICFDMLADALYDGPLSRTILGPPENIARFGKSDIEKYMNLHYCPQNIVISFAGGITKEKADEWIRKYFLPYMKIFGKCDHGEENRFAVKTNMRIGFEQSNLFIGFPSIPFNHELIPAQSILSFILGGGMSSRLFQKIREEMGLAYSVYTTPSVYYNAGSFNICVNYSAENTSKVLDAIKKQIELLIEKGIQDDEFERAKTQIKTAMAFAQESSQSQMMAHGKLLLLADEIYDMDQKLDEINRLSLDRVNDFARKLFMDKKPAIAYLGKEPDIKPVW